MGLSIQTENDIRKAAKYAKLAYQCNIPIISKVLRNKMMKNISKIVDNEIETRLKDLNI